ncbi:MCE family protein [Nocardioides ferulae]|uniref:MCE family protein n=1 Tax=Nocardioides ferulae TaxID=2340821 RepID=UPI000EB108A7|nr:MCE family protein [Nocardioides ferulae]
MSLVRSPKILGVVFLALVVLAVYATYATFTKKFVDYDEVTLETSNIGLQLPMRADVKIRGVIVGEVLDLESTGEGAEITLGLFPDKREIIPADVTGSIVPKTLFGEKYVSLVVPDGAAADPIAEGDVIERTQVATEVEEVLSDLYPLLRTVQPAELNMTLNAIATALEGRGERLGENLETLDSYLKRFNPLIPDLVEDLQLTAEVSDVYAEVLPEVSQILRDSITTSGTLEDREAKLQALFADVTSFSGTARGFLADNGDNIIRFGRINQLALRVLAKYAPEFPCLTQGLVNAGKLQAEAFRGSTLHIVLETLPNQPRAYNVNDQPRVGEDRGPNCLHLPNPPWSQENPLRHVPNLDDGVDEPTGKGVMRAATGWAATAGIGSGYGLGSTPGESALLKSLLGPGLGTTAEDVPDLGVLLVGPMAKGAEVSLR